MIESVARQPLLRLAKRSQRSGAKAEVSAIHWLVFSTCRLQLLEGENKEHLKEASIDLLAVKMHGWKRGWMDGCLFSGEVV